MFLKLDVALDDRLIVAGDVEAERDRESARVFDKLVRKEIEILRQVVYVAVQRRLDPRDDTFVKKLLTLLRIGAQFEAVADFGWIASGVRCCLLRESNPCA